MLKITVSTTYQCDLCPQLKRVQSKVVHGTKYPTAELPEGWSGVLHGCCQVCFCPRCTDDPNTEAERNRRGLAAITAMYDAR